MIFESLMNAVLREPFESKQKILGSAVGGAADQAHAALVRRA